MRHLRLRSKSHDFAILLPARATQARPWRGHGGVFTSTGQYDETSRLVRDYAAVVDEPPECPVKVRQHVDQECIFAGYLIADHFGHFLLESCARLWFARDRPELTLLWAHGGAFRPFNRSILSILGIRNPSIFVQNPVRVSRLHVPTVGYRIRDAASTEHMKFLGSWANTCQAVSKGWTGKKIWISRAGLSKNHGRIVQEPQITHKLSRAGWMIFEPEQHSVEDQLRMLSGAQHVAGFMGSAFHTLALLSCFSGKITIFSRGIPNENFATIATARQLDQTIIDLPLARVSGHGASTQWTLDDLPLVYRPLGLN